MLLAIKFSDVVILAALEERSLHLIADTVKTMSMSVIAHQSVCRLAFLLLKIKKTLILFLFWQLQPMIVIILVSMLINSFHFISTAIVLITMEVSRSSHHSAVVVEVLCSGRVGVRGCRLLSLSLSVTNTTTTHRQTCASSPWTSTSDTTSVVIWKVSLCSLSHYAL
jgi:hypothetical protein